MIFASSPPNSIATSVFGAIVSMAFAVATTSCIKSIFNDFAIETPPLPVSIALKQIFPKSFFASSSNSAVVFFISEKCLLY